ncbi:MAG: FAD-binding protein, partial [Blautia sp.]|nr:FAD-binding protein [Blautia sp.]
MLREKNLTRKDFLKGASALGLSALLSQSLKAQEKALYTPGTYEGSARGMESTVTVTLTVDETSILSAVVDASGETAGIGAAAAEELAGQLVETQGIMIDGVAGATVTSEAVRKAAAIALAEAQGVDVSVLMPAEEEGESEGGWLPKEPQIDAAEIKEVIDCDVLVVGAGNAGLFAAASAVENGAKTILVERFAHDMASGIRDTFAAVGSKQQIEDGENPDPKAVLRYLRDWSQGYASEALIRKFLELSGETMDWYTDVLAQGGMEFRHEIDGHAEGSNYEYLEVGHSVQYGEEYYEQLTMDKLLDYALPLGLVIDYETTLVKLVKEEGKVTGIIAKNAAGDYVQYKASKGTIIATGGYSGNLDMMKALQPWSVEQTCIDYSKPGSKGDGIKACLWAGAVMDETHAAMIFDRG